MHTKNQTMVRTRTDESIQPLNGAHYFHWTAMAARVPPSTTKAPKVAEMAEPAFALLYAEALRYSRTRVQSTAALEARLADLGDAVGRRVLDLLSVRDRHHKREPTVVGLLLYIQQTVWKFLFGRAADSLERTADGSDAVRVERRLSPVRRLTRLFSVPSHRQGAVDK